MKELELMTIAGYADADLKKPVKGGPYQLMINPSSINWMRSLEYFESQPTASVDPPGQFKTRPGEKISFDIVIDCTGIVDKERTDMTVEFEALKRNIFESGGNHNQPIFVKLTWGKDIEFCGVLTTFETNFTLFNTNGTPIRAKISLAFSKYIPVG